MMDDPSLSPFSKKEMDLCCHEDAGYWNLKRNATGHFISKEGIYSEIVDWLAISMDTHYECLPENENERYTRDKITNKETWTSLYRLKNELCLMAPGPYLMTHDRFKHFDFLHPVFNDPNGILIPEPSLSLGGISSIWMPFETQVWTVLLISLAITLVLSLFEWVYHRQRTTQTNGNQIELHGLFIFGLLVSKAGFRAPKKFNMRLIGGAWCLAALILTNYYSSALISFITSANPQSLVNSAEELANKDSVGLVVLKNYVADTTISNRDTMRKKLDDKLKSNPFSHYCSKPNECIEQVVQTGKNVYIHPKRNIISALDRYLNKNDSCNVTFAKGEFGSTTATWAISKNSPYFETFQRGLLRIIETGLLKKWEIRFLPKPRQCSLDPYERKEKWAEVRHPAVVNFSSLHSAFVYLFLGLTFSFLAFSAEILISKFCSTIFQERAHIIVV